MDFSKFRKPAPAQVTPAQASAAPQRAPAEPPKVTPRATGIFGQSFQQAKPAQHGEYIRPGDHVLELIQCKAISGPKDGRMRTAFLAEFRVVESEGPNPHRAGSVVSWYVDLASIGGEGDVKSFIAALINFQVPRAQETSVEDIGFELANALIETPPEGQPAMGAGSMVHVHAHAVTTRKGGLFTKMSWNPIFAD